MALRAAPKAVGSPTTGIVLWKFQKIGRGKSLHSLLVARGASFFFFVCLFVCVCVCVCVCVFKKKKMKKRMKRQKKKY